MANRAEVSRHQGQTPGQSPVENGSGEANSRTRTPIEAKHKKAGSEDPAERKKRGDPIGPPDYRHLSLHVMKHVYFQCLKHHIKYLLNPILNQKLKTE